MGNTHLIIRTMKTLSYLRYMTLLNKILPHKRVRIDLHRLNLIFINHSSYFANKKTVTSTLFIFNTFPFGLSSIIPLNEKATSLISYRLSFIKVLYEYFNCLSYKGRKIS
jgi:hypothetical protein